VMSPRPGRIVAEFDVDLPPHASRRELIGHPGFVRLRERILELLESAA
jgi:ABC-type nitrate/sulfonate/bicarbonate transport system ATPase subunit